MALRSVLMPLRRPKILMTSLLVRAPLSETCNRAPAWVCPHQWPGSGTLRTVTTPSRGRRGTGTSKRSIHFFRIDGGADESGVPVDVNLHPALQKIDGLPFREVTTGGRYVTSGDIDLCAWIDEVAEICKIRFANVRRNALPQAEAGGELTDLVVADDAGICEASHLCIFPDGIVGIEFNFYGPRPSRLAWYLRRVVGDDCPEFKLEALLRQDVAAVLQRKNAVRKLSHNVRRPYIDVIEQANASLGSALRAAETASRADCVGVYLEPEPYQRRNLDGGILGMLRSLAPRSDLRENARTLKATVIDAETDRAEEIDLLRDELISQKKILRLHDRTRVLLSDDAYAKIAEAYAERRDDLAAAASVAVAGG